MPKYQIKLDLSRASDCKYLDTIIVEVSATDEDDARCLVTIALQNEYPRNSIDCEDLLPDVNEEDLPEYGEGRGLEPTKPKPDNWDEVKEEEAKRAEETAFKTGF